METFDTTKQGSLANGCINTLLDLEYKDACQRRHEPLQTIEEQANFYKMSRLAREYAAVFYKELAIEDIVLDFTSHVLPIIFTPETEVVVRTLKYDPTARIFHAGAVTQDPFEEGRFVIEIALPARRKMSYLSKALKATIRHELIHYYLRLKGFPYKDDTALFWAYCYIYDGKAYQALEPEEREKYLQFVQEAEKDIAGETPLYAIHFLAEAIILNDEYALKKYRQIKENHQVYLDQLQRNVDLGSTTDHI